MLVPCKTDKGTTICSLKHHDEDGDAEPTDIFRYCYWAPRQQHAVSVPHCTTQHWSLSNKHHTSLSKLSLGPLVAIVLAALSDLALAAWNLLLHFLLKIPFPALCLSWLWAFSVCANKMLGLTRFPCAPSSARKHIMNVSPLFLPDLISKRSYKQ